MDHIPGGRQNLMVVASVERFSSGKAFASKSHKELIVVYVVREVVRLRL